MPDIRIGISGWRYAPWRGVFYPEGLPQRQELAWASRALPTIEINGSFYSLQKPQYYADWAAAVPDDFVFSVKAPRFITHIRRLREIEKPLANFFASGLFELEHKLGPILWQLPTSLVYDALLIEDFLLQLPMDDTAALKLARSHEDWIDGRSSLPAAGGRSLRHAVEVRNVSFVDPMFIDQLREHGVALVVADTAGKWPDHEDVTADFVYVRLYGHEQLYASGYNDASLDSCARKIDAWSRGTQASDTQLIQPAGRVRGPQDREPKSRDVYCYFDNDIKVKAPFDAARLQRRLKLDSTLDEAGHFEVELPPTDARQLPLA